MRMTCLFKQSQCVDHGLRHEVRIREGSEFHEPRTIGKIVQQSKARLNRETRLSNPSDTDECNQSIRFDKVNNFIFFLFTPNKA